MKTMSTQGLNFLFPSRHKATAEHDLRPVPEASLPVVDHKT
jgi:hypothetical protein